MLPIELASVFFQLQLILSWDSLTGCWVSLRDLRPRKQPLQQASSFPENGKIYIYILTCLEFTGIAAIWEKLTSELEVLILTIWRTWEAMQEQPALADAAAGPVGVTSVRKEKKEK